jgi:hypothetical protein
VIPAFVLTVLLALLALFQLTLISGAPWGRFAWGGQNRVLPARQRVGSAVSILIYALIAAIVLDRGGVIDALPQPISEIAIWVVLGFFFVSILPNLASRSRPEKFTMVPVTIVLAVLSLLVALS